MTPNPRATVTTRAVLAKNDDERRSMDTCCVSFFKPLKTHASRSTGRHAGGDDGYAPPREALGADGRERETLGDVSVS
jgi:hypothetical protein